MPRDFGQVLVYVALVLPLVLLPVAAYAVAATALDTRHARLQAAVSQAAEDAVQRLDQAAFRAGAAHPGFFSSRRLTEVSKYPKFR